MGNSVDGLELIRKCFCCEKHLEHCGPGGPDTIVNPPNNATYWQTRGNYGSAVFDCGELYSELLEMFICDECLIRKSSLVFRYSTRLTRAAENIRIFDPNEAEHVRDSPSPVPQSERG